jgi:hypothetical protein
MGYTTDFNGSFTSDRPFEQHHADYLRAFNATRRMKRNPEIAEKIPDPIRINAGLPIGPDGCFFVGSTENFGQNNDASVIDHNSAPGHIPYSSGMEFEKRYSKNQQAIDNGFAQPGLWCQWTVSEKGDEIVWDEGEKFYEYINWLKYIINNFIGPWGYILNGIVEWSGEEQGDVGRIVVTNNAVTTE